ncbi:MAG: M3 family oligoendopeptidase [Eubacteriales bacterium]
MKVSEIPYVRYTIEEGKEAFEEFRKSVTAAKSARDVMAAREKFMGCYIDFVTAASLSNCRFTLNTRDEFYQNEKDYYDHATPLFQEIMVEYADIMLTSKYRNELEKMLNPRIFKSYEIAQKAFSKDTIEELQTENAITTEYSKFMSEMVFHFNGEDMPLSVLRGYFENSDRKIRKDAAQALGQGLAKNADRLDDIYDRLVKIRDQIAKKMGYENFIELGYYRMSRMDYDAPMVSNFRKNVACDLVPVVKKLKESIAEKFGWERFMFYDNEVYSVGETLKPNLSVDGIFAAAVEMYDDMDLDVGKFMHEMIEAEAFDVLPRDGKWGGGYCTTFMKYQQPFILANFNGGCGDIDVITHEFGHALAAKHVFRYGDIELNVGGMETAECHSMGMEFFCERYMEKFFGENADKYRYKHLMDALSFIPYGVIVDEFQHIVYAHPEMTPAQRKEAYLSLEKKYRPYLSYEGIEYLEEGTRWQYQMHIYETPFYYIDYCLAQTVAIEFFIASKDNYRNALQKYLEFSKKGGTQAFESLVKGAGLVSPFEEGALRNIFGEVEKIIEGFEA